jgi:hypothetical protein
VASANKSIETRRTAVRTVEQEQVVSAELGLPPSVQAALGELVNAAKEGLLALSVGVGLGVLSTLMEEEVSEVVGPRGATIATARRFVTATPAVRSPSAGGVSACRGHACGRSTARRSSL